MANMISQWLQEYAWYRPLETRLEVLHCMSMTIEYKHSTTEVNKDLRPSQQEHQCGY